MMSGYHPVFLGSNPNIENFHVQHFQELLVCDGLGHNEWYWEKLSPTLARDSVKIDYLSGGKNSESHILPLLLFTFYFTYSHGLSTNTCRGGAF